MRADAEDFASNPGVDGSNIEKASATGLLAAIVGLFLVCTLGGLPVLLYAAAPYVLDRPPDPDGLDLRGLAADLARTLSFVEAYWLPILVWSAVSGSLATVLVLESAFSLFRRGAWREILLTYVFSSFGLFALIAVAGLHDYVGAMFDPRFGLYGLHSRLYDSTILVLSGGATGIVLARGYYHYFVFLAETLVPPDLSGDADSLQRRGQAQGPQTSTPIEYRKECPSQLRRVFVWHAAFGGLFAAAGVAGYVFLDDGGGNLIGRGVAFFWFALTAKYVLICLSERHFMADNGGRVRIDRNGLSLDDGPLAWSEVGRVWVGGNGNIVLIEVPEAVRERITGGTPWFIHILTLGERRFLRKHLGVQPLALESIWFPETGAEEIRDAIAARRPRGTMWVSAAPFS